jgi:hypothetical protein
MKRQTMGDTAPQPLVDYHILGSWTLANSTKQVISGDFSLKGSHGSTLFEGQTD